MLKKPVILLMVLLYFVTATGFALNVHYCFNRVASVKLDAPVKGCESNPQKVKRACCKDKQIKVKVKDEHQASTNSFFSKFIFFHLPKLPFEDFLFSVQKAIAERFVERGPPLFITSGTSILKKICIFRI